MRHLTETDYVTSTWSGGKTIEIAIRPEGAVYAGRDFLWRISSATVELEESDFTVLPDYDRLIAPLSGRMELVHRKAEATDDPGTGPFLLSPYTVHSFDGGDLTHSKGQCTDFNLMLRKGKCTGRISPIRPGEDGVKGQHFEPGAGTDILLLYAAKGGAAVFFKDAIEQLIEKEALLLEKEEITSFELALPPGGCVMAVEISS